MVLLLPPEVLKYDMWGGYLLSSHVMERSYIRICVQNIQHFLHRSTQCKNASSTPQNRFYERNERHFYVYIIRLWNSLP